MPPADPLKDLLELVRTAARDGVVEGLQTQVPAAPKPVTPLVDKKTLAHALAVSTAKVDRLVKKGEIAYVMVGEVRRFDLEAVRIALAKRQERENGAGSAPDLARVSAEPSGVRLLSRGKRA